MVYRLAYVVIKNTARLPDTAFGFVAHCAAFNVVVGSVKLCVAVFHNLAVLPALEALGGFYNFTYLAAYAVRELLKKLSGCCIGSLRVAFCMPP